MMHAWKSTSPREIRYEETDQLVRVKTSGAIESTTGHRARVGRDQSALIKAVPVADSPSIAIASTVAQPITLPPSTTHAVSGTVTLNPESTETVAFVAAKQPIDTGVAVTVKTRAADLLSGAYVLTLSAEA